MDDKNIEELFFIRHQFRHNGISKLQLMNEHKTFHTKFEKCFDMICDSKCDDDILNKIINARKSVMTGNTSQHDASVVVGQKLVDKYVIPTVSKE